MSEISLNGKLYYEPELNTQLALEAVGIYTFSFFPQDGLIMVSDLVVQKFGGSKFFSDLDESKYILQAHPSENKKIKKLFDDIASGVEKVSEQIRANDEERLMKISISTHEWNQNGEPTVAIGIIQPLGDHLRQHEMIHALSSNFDSVFYVNIDENLIYTIRINDEIKEMLGSALSENSKYSDAMFAYIDTAVLAEDKEMMVNETSLENLREQFKNKNSYQFDYKRFKNDRIYYYRVKFVNMSGEGDIHRMVVGFSDVSSEKSKELERMAYIDSVTGGDNYESFKRKLKDKSTNGYMISMDIHSFKIVNTICGIVKGDCTLKEIWRCIKRSMGENDLAGHINADRFVIFLMRDSEAEVKKYLSDLSDALQQLSTTLEIPVLIPYFGVSEWKSSMKIEEVYGEANFAKNQIKERKDVFCQFYSHADTKKMLEEKAMEDSFFGDLSAGRFEVWYQPKFDPTTDKLAGAEGLVRWRKEDGSLVSPGAFIPLFERDGLIKILDEYVFMTVCQQQMEWKKQGKKIVPVSINLSRASLYYETVVTDYHMIAEEIGIDTRFVPIEITESAAIDNKNIKDISDKFHANGFDLQVDDFGAGYSSLAALNMKCFDVLKIDKSLIDFIGDYSGECLLAHTIALAKQLGLYVTAEGVETKGQVDFLKEIKCDSIQGYYYARPMPAQEYFNYIY